AMGLAACRGFFGQAPIALLVTDTAGDQEVPITITFDISGSTDPDGTIATYDLDFGDGSTHATGTDVADVITHDYEEAGTYTVLLTITDNDGRIGMVNAVVTVGPIMITFAANRVADYDIYRMQGDGTDQGAVNNTADDELFPDLVRGTRDKITFAAEDNTSWNIWTMTVTGGSLNQLTVQTLSNQIQPSWASDGSAIAYASNTEDGTSATSWELFTMTALGGSQTKLTTQTPSWAIAPAYSPVNDDILFVSNKTALGGSSIWLWDDSLGAAVELFDSDNRDGDPSPADIVAGITSTVLNLPPGAGVSKPAWSPDGTKIAFSRERDTGEIDIFVMDADGTGPESLESYVDGLGVLNTSITTDDDEFCPYWLEDGSGICYVKADGSGDYQIYKVTFATGVI
ncbi:PD40 domain-containing protein, partial [Candidatus Bipolaricaulota bacterium]|nr:PD40 domain-containing protein [Candidatus Bipolaricaulota bacterium]